MIRPAREAAPLFSQPVRQIVMMLVVTLLVGVGAWFAFSSIFPIFLSNVWLNGAILVVFLLGVLACFWQVIQLVGSVSWIEAFAIGRSGQDIAAPPQLLAPLAALLRSRGARGGQISNSSARSILESVASRIDEARDITRYLSNLLIFLGLLGTFFGLATTVPGVVDTIRALAPQEGQSASDAFENLMGGLGTQLSGMGTAFSSSLLGLAGSLVIGLLELFAGHGQSRFYRELEEWLSSFTRLSFAGGEGESGFDQGAIAGVLDHMAEQMETLENIFARSDAGRVMLEERVSALTAAVQRMTEQVAVESGAAEALARIADGQARMIGLMEANAGAGAGLDGGDAESRMRLRSIDVQLLKLLEEVAAGRQESMADLRSDLAQLTRAVRALARVAETPAPARRG
jgi:hypothetical protein